MQTNKLTHVLIDFENIQPANLKDFPLDTNIHMFVGANQKSIKVDLVADLQVLGPRVRYIKLTSTGHNALDFVLATEIGLLVGKYPNSHIAILSNDTGFDYIVEHYRERLNISRIVDIRELDPAFKLPVEELTKSDPNYLEGYVEAIEILNGKESRPVSKTALKNHLTHKLGQRLNLSNVAIGLIVKRLVSRGIIKLGSDGLSYHGVCKRTPNKRLFN